LPAANYIEGLFLSSGIVRSPDYTVEQIVEVARSLREDHHFRGYIHLKTIPDADPELVRRAGLHADRVSINVELPTAAGLARLAPGEGRRPDRGGDEGHARRDRGRRGFEEALQGRFSAGEVAAAAVARLTASIAKVRPAIEAEGWRPTLLTERADLGAWLKPREKQLELFT
jgi:predicted DNA-binding helix-hairpin-helix protein